MTDTATWPPTAPPPLFSAAQNWLPRSISAPPATPPRQSDSHVNIKGFRFREFKISDQTFGMDILCAEEEILSLFHHMGMIPTNAS